MPCSLTSTALFRRLAKVGVVRGENLITPCAESQVGDIVINDRLRRVSQSARRSRYSPRERLPLDAEYIAAPRPRPLSASLCPQILVDEEDEDWHLFSAGERAELLVQLLRLLVVGGKWCQYEDTVTPYIDTARAIYKDLVRCADQPRINTHVHLTAEAFGQAWFLVDSVEKDPDGLVVVRSVVLKVVARDENGEPILPLNPDHPQDVVFLCIDPVRRTVNVLSHHFGEDLVE